MVFTRPLTITLSLALFNYRTQLHIGVGSMTLPVVMAGDRAVKMSEDQRQALCYQFHVTRVMYTTDQAGTGDDRTTTCVHEGLSCLCCHRNPRHECRRLLRHLPPPLLQLRHDRRQNDFPLQLPKSPFDIHTVDCINCHPKGVPPRRNIGPRPTD